MRVIQASRGSCANKDSNTEHGQLLIPSQLEMRTDHTEKAVHARANSGFLALGSVRWWSRPSLLPLI